MVHHVYPGPDSPEPKGIDHKLQRIQKADFLTPWNIKI